MLSDTLFSKVRIDEADAAEWLAEQPAESIDLIITSPPYAEQRKDSYGGIPADDYVSWWLPIHRNMFLALRDTGSLILNIKEHVSQGERHSYVYDLVSQMRSDGWKLIDELIWHKTNPLPFHHANRLRDGYERLFHFATQTKVKIRHDAVRVPPAESTTRRVSNLTAKDKTRRL